MRLWALLLLMFLPAPAMACRLALVLALDVSGSVDDREYALQLQGVAEALTDDAVTDALLAIPDAPVALAVFEWSAASYQSVILDWTVIEDEGDILSAAARIRTHPRRAAPEATGLGRAMLVAGEQLGRAPDCWRQVVDISGDGRNNDWPEPRVARTGSLLSGVTINGLLIDDRVNPVEDLEAYFRSEVLHGPDAFLEIARGFDDYARAMQRKLIKEISAPAVASAAPRGTGRIPPPRH